jgi:hypothetical protein
MKILSMGPRKLKGRVLKRFLWQIDKVKRVVQPGEEIEFTIDAATDFLGLVQMGRIYPCDLPAIGEYRALVSFTLPGKAKQFEAKVGDLVELRADDALKLMFSRAVIPTNPEQWCPFELRKDARPQPLQPVSHERPNTWSSNWTPRKDRL